MANLQTRFNQFHNRIKLELQKKSNLAEKRDKIIGKIKNSLKEADVNLPEIINKGSYIHGTGVRPALPTEKYDLDVGLKFSINYNECDSSTLLGFICQCIKNHTKSIEKKRYCIRVHYEDKYYVDITVFSEYEGVVKIATDEGWKDADPEGLKSCIEDYKKLFSNTEEDGACQFCRLVRYLKRWADLLPLSEKPSGLALLFLVAEYCKTRVVDSDGRSDDLQALHTIAYSVINSFIDSRISIRKPVKPYDDLFCKITDEEMNKLIQEFYTLKVALQKAIDELDENKACQYLEKVFGKDFPVPEKIDTLLDNIVKNPATHPTRPYSNS